jgi:hypothetical protein
VRSFYFDHVFELLSEADIVALLAEAHRVLSEGRLLGLVSMTHGPTRTSHFIERIWPALHSFRQSLVDGCRPIGIMDFYRPILMADIHRRTIIRFGIPSEVVVAKALPE